MHQKLKAALEAYLEADRNRSAARRAPHEREALRLIAHQEHVLARARRFDWLAWLEARRSLVRSARLGGVAARAWAQFHRTQARMVALVLGIS